jgi:hypothetical protein
LVVGEIFCRGERVISIYSGDFSAATFTAIEGEQRSFSESFEWDNPLLRGSVFS